MSCGFPTRSGHPCKNSGVYVDGRCHHHTETHEKNPKKIKRQRSKGECQVYQACMLTPLKSLGKFKENVRPNILRNPETGRNLELDFFFEERKVAIEYDGRQHHEYVPYFHRRGIVDFEAQQRRDRLKDALCHRHGIKLVRVSHKIRRDSAVYRKICESLFKVY